ncbi:MAG TPA: hypothetical protein O0W81_01895 [Methanocorpusculum sp.]|nr:hypothetical protein [Methanocorpusculum sp.]
MAIIEIQINRLGINSLELSKNAVKVKAGTALHVRFVNHGSPTHATLRCEASTYTDFTYENIYVSGELELEIKIKEGAGTGNFNMQVITGYGMRHEEFTIHVLRSYQETLPKQNIAPIELATETTKKRFNSNVSAKNAIIRSIMPIIAASLIVLKQSNYCNINEQTIAIIVYLIMLVGVIIAWYLGK